jgi:hypothetical protein
MAAVRPRVGAVMALAGAGIIVAPIAPTPDVHIVRQDVRLVDASDPLDGLTTSLANLGDLSNLTGDLTGIGAATDLGDLGNIAENLAIDIYNIPYDEFEAPFTLPADLAYAAPGGPSFDEGGGSLSNLPTVTDGAINEVTNSLNYSGDLWVFDSTNIWGFDPGDPPKLAALIDAMVPFQALSQPLGEQLNIIGEAGFPETAACPFLCTDPLGLLTGLSQVSISQLESGYTFGPVVDEFTGDLLPWANTTVTLNPDAPFDDFLTSLEADPSTNTIEPLPSLGTVGTDLGNLLTATWNFINPFVPNNEIVDALGASDTDSTLVTELTTLLDTSALSGDLSGVLGDLSTLF